MSWLLFPGSLRLVHVLALARCTRVHCCGAPLLCCAVVFCCSTLQQCTAAVLYCCVLLQYTATVDCCSAHFSKAPGPTQQEGLRMHRPEAQCVRKWQHSVFVGCSAHVVQLQYKIPGTHSLVSTGLTIHLILDAAGASVSSPMGHFFIYCVSALSCCDRDDTLPTHVYNNLAKVAEK